MTSDITAEQVELRRKGRQRLIGAVALALVAVVFVPMLLDPEPSHERAEPLLAIPPKEGAAPLAAITRTPQAPASATPAQAVPPAPVKASPPDGTASSAPPPAATTAAAPHAAQPKPEPAHAAPPKLEGFAVQVGAFKEGARLEQARAKLTAAGISHFTERLPEFTRLRAGPYPTREAAEKAALKVKRAGLEARVVPLP